MSANVINEYQPDRVTHPGETLLDAIEEVGMSQSELADRTGRPKKTINEIIKGLASIVPETALQLERVLGIPATFWISRQRHYDEAEARANERRRLVGHSAWVKNFPISQMVRLGWLANSQSAVGKLEVLLSFLGISSPDEWSSIWESPRMQAAFRTSEAYSTSPYALSAWLRRGEAEAAGLSPGPYDRSRFHDALQKVRTMAFDIPAGFDHKIQELCASTGVAVVFIPLIKGVHAWGASRWLSPDRALLQLSLKGKYEDVFWFTFFHEAAHILLHGKKCVFVDGGPAGKNREEEEADSWASEFLIPRSLWSSFARGKKVFTESDVRAFAQSAATSPAIVVGRLQHEKLLPNTHLNGLRSRIQFSQEHKS